MLIAASGRNAALTTAFFSRKGMFDKKRTKLCKTKPIYAVFGPKTNICGKNKAKQTQFKANSKPIFSAAKREISGFMTGRYGNMRLCGRAENKPNSKPIQTQFQRQRNL
jgi:hypothetical protein